MSLILSVIRSMLFYAILSLFTAVWCTVMIAMAPFIPKKRRHLIIVKAWAHAAMFLLRCICGIRYDVRGRENIPDEPCVIICNHQSTWETFFTQTLFTPQSQVIKKELLSIPFFGWAFRFVNPIAINRNDPRAAIHDIVNQGIKAIGEGRSVLIFPEGTRTPHGGLGKFSRGGANLARKAEANVVPVAHNAADHWPMETFIKRPGTIQLRVGSAISTTDKTALTITNEAYHWIEKNLEEIKKKK